MDEAPASFGEITAIVLTFLPVSDTLAAVMEHLEIELKFYLSDPDALRARLPGLGAVRTGRRIFETNVRYDSDDDRLKKHGCLLRLRKDRDTILTFKSPPKDPDPRFKVYRELETRLDDFNTMDAILEALGFKRRQAYEKWRETWQLEGADLCLDTMPFGSFLEIEGPPDTIPRIAGALGLSWHHRILGNYLGIFSVLREREGLTFTDLTFENFKSVDLSFDEYRRLFESGDPPGTD